MGILQTPKGSLLCSPWSDMEFQTCPRLYSCLITCKNQENPIKNLGPRVFTTLNINFSDVQGQITPELVVVSGRNLNSSMLACISSLPARLRLIDTNMKELEFSQNFFHYKSMGIFQDTQGQLTPQSLVRSGPISNSFEKL